MTWEYISGFLDADGYVSFMRTRKCESKTAIIGFTNNELLILNKIKSFIFKELGINGVISKKSNKFTSNINYDLKYSNLTKVLALIPYLKLEHPKKAFRLALIDSKLKLITPRNGKYTKELLEKRLEFDQEFLRYG